MASTAPATWPPMKVVHVRGRALVRHVHHLHADAFAEQHAEEVRQAAGAGRRVAGLGRIRLRPRGELVPRLGAAHRPCGDRELERRAERDRREVLDRVVRDVLVHVRHDGHRADRLHHEHRAVRRRGLDRVGRDAADGAGTILDDHRLAERGRHLLGDDARDDVGGAARREADEDLDRLVDLVLRERGRGTGSGGAQREAGGEGREASFHVDLLLGAGRSLGALAARREQYSYSRYDGSTLSSMRSSACPRVARARCGPGRANCAATLARHGGRRQRDGVPPPAAPPPAPGMRARDGS